MLLMSLTTLAITPGDSPLLCERPQPKSDCRLDLIHVVSNRLTVSELEAVLRKPVEPQHPAAVVAAIEEHGGFGCNARHFGQVCERTEYVLKRVARRSGHLGATEFRASSYANEREMFCRLRGARYMQRLLFFDDDCQVFVMENVQRRVQQLDPSRHVKTLLSNQALLERHGGNASALVAYQSRVIQSMFDTFRRALILPYDLSVCCNLLRTDQRGTLGAIDFGAYRPLNDSTADERPFAIELEWCQESLMLELRRAVHLEPPAPRGAKSFRCAGNYGASLGR